MKKLFLVLISLIYLAKAQIFPHTSRMTTQQVGSGNQGRPFSNTHTSGIKQLCVHTLSHGSGTIIGRMDALFHNNRREGWASDRQSQRCKNFQRGEVFTNFKISTVDDGWGTYVSGFSFKSNRGTYTFGTLDNRRTINVRGGGQIIGFVGRSGTKTDRLGFHLITGTKEVVMTNVRYQTGSARYEHGRPQSAFVKYVENCLRNRNARSEIGETHSFTQTHSIANSFGVSNGIKVSATLKLPTFEAGLEFSTTVTVTTTTGKSVQRARSLVYKESISVGPRRRVQISGMFRQTKLSIPYLANFRVTYHNGEVKNFNNLRATYNGVLGSHVEVTFKGAGRAQNCNNDSVLQELLDQIQ